MQRIKRRLPDGKGMEGGVDKVKGIKKYELAVVKLVVEMQSTAWGI